MPKKVDTASFISNSISMHGNKYDYSKTEYVNNKTNVTIICPEHGDFPTSPHNFLKGSGCPKCANKFRSYTSETWILKAKSIHGDEYNYSKVKYVNAHKKITIICKKHGQFDQIPTNHLSGSACSLCSLKQRTKKVKPEWLSLEEFIKAESNPDL